ncbi:MAG: lysylphosphatidylglycerol synthase domain-containing protein, partial [Bacteroidota bacterium]
MSMQPLLRSIPLRLESLLLIVRLLVLGLMLSYIGFILHQKEASLTTLYQQWLLVKEQGLFLPLLLLLGLINWSLEAQKWRLLASKVEPISWKEAFKGVLAGLSLGFVTPNTVGDYAARIWMLENRNRMEAIGAVMLGRVAQLYITLMAGGVALMYFCLTQTPPQTTLFYTVLATWLIFLGAGIYVAIDRVVPHRAFISSLEKIRWLQFSSSYFQVLTLYKSSEVFQVLGLALLRYVVFSSQFLLLLWIFGVRLPLPDLLTGIGLVYLAKSVVP